jgi:hypothetical protein
MKYYLLLKMEAFITVVQGVYYAIIPLSALKWRNKKNQIFVYRTLL